MTTTVPGVQTVKPSSGSKRRGGTKRSPVKVESVQAEVVIPRTLPASSPQGNKPPDVSDEAWAFDDDPTIYGGADVSARKQGGTKRSAGKAEVVIPRTPPQFPPQWNKPPDVSDEEWAFDDDPTIYPDYEQMGRDPVESDITEALEPVIRRYLNEHGIDCYIGSDNFIYWVKGNSRSSVSPDIYVFPSIPSKVNPRDFKGHKDEGCWKTWIHGASPSFALEVKAWRNPRKDELQSPVRHDGLGTKELIVYDPFANRRRGARKRFAVYRRDAVGAFPKVFETNDFRIYSETLGVYLVVDPIDLFMLRIGVDSNGEKLLPFDAELVDLEARRANDATRRANEATRCAEEQARMRQEEARLRQEEARRADEATQRAAELEAELARLRAMLEAESLQAGKK